MANNAKKFVELFEKREKLKGTKITRTLRNLSTSQYAVNKNYEELHAAITSYECNMEIWDVKNRAQFEAFLWELSRLVQNYVLSTYTLIEHNRRFCEEAKMH